jgi:hypothetical protein
MNTLWRHYAHIIVLDFEFHAPPGERPTPLCVVAQDLCTSRVLRAWLYESTPPAWPWMPTPETLVVAYFASAEMACFLALDWPFPVRLLDLYTEYRNLTSGWSMPAGYGLLGAMSAFGLEGMAALTKEDMRQLAIRGGPYTAAEREALVHYCQDDVEALARLLPVMLPYIDLPRALWRGRYMCAVARMEWTGTPCDTDSLTEIRSQWDMVRSRLARAVNPQYGVFVPAEQPVLDPESSFGAAVLQTAAVHGLNPYHLAVAATQV